MEIWGPGPGPGAGGGVGEVLGVGDLGPPTPVVHILGLMRDRLAGCGWSRVESVYFVPASRDVCSRGYLSCGQLSDFLLMAVTVSADLFRFDAASTPSVLGYFVALFEDPGRDGAGLHFSQGWV